MRIDPDGYPFISKPTLIGPGLFSKISLNKQQSEVLPYPYSDCVDTSNEQLMKSNRISQVLKQIGIKYTYEYCLKILTQTLQIDIFGCYDVNYIKLPSDNDMLKECNANDYQNKAKLELYQKTYVINYKKKIY